MSKIDYGKNTKLLGTLGYPLGHSIVPLIYNTVFERANINAVLLPMEIKNTNGNLTAFFNAVKLLKIRGFIVTMPYKNLVAPYMDEISEEYRLLNCINAVKYENNKFYGAAYDGYGLCQSIEDAGYSLKGRNALIIGAGAVCGPIVFEMAKRGAKAFTILNRTEETALYKAELLRGITKHEIKGGALTENALNSAVKDVEIIVQCTPLGMYGTNDNFTNLSFLEKANKNTLIADVIYNPPESEFLKAAKALGLPVINGLGMVINQINKIAGFFFSDNKIYIDNKDAEKLVTAAMENLRRS